MASAENILEMPNSERFKRGHGKPGKMGILGKRENIISVKNTKHQKLSHSTALHSQGYWSVLTTLKCDLTKCLKTYVLVRNALKFSVWNTAFPTGLIQIGPLKMSFHTGLIKVKCKTNKFWEDRLESSLENGKHCPWGGKGESKKGFKKAVASF